MGVLAPGSAHADPPLGPPSTLAEIFRHTCLQSKLQNFRKKPKQTLKIVPGGGGGGRGGGVGVGQKEIYQKFYLY
jgi:hypothetical protein